MVAIVIVPSALKVAAEFAVKQLAPHSEGESFTVALRSAQSPVATDTLGLRADYLERDQRADSQPARVATVYRNVRVCDLHARRGTRGISSPPGEARVGTVDARGSRVLNPSSQCLPLCWRRCHCVVMSARVIPLRPPSIPECGAPC
jgi:hypothetical protein